MVDGTGRKQHFSTAFFGILQVLSLLCGLCGAQIVTKAKLYQAEMSFGMYWLDSCTIDAKIVTAEDMAYPLDNGLCYLCIHCIGQFHSVLPFPCLELFGNSITQSVLNVKKH